MPHVFVSYANANQPIAERLCTTLERNGVTCWIAPRNIEPGASWPESILAAIADSWLMICVASPDAYHSKQVARELERADSHNVAILPVRVDAAPLDGELQFFLGNRQWLDVSDGSPEAFDAIVPAVRAIEQERSALRQAGLGPAATNAADRGEVAVPQPRGGAGSIVRDELARVVNTFVTILTRRERALDPVALANQRTLYFALRFLVYASLFSLLFHIPAWSAQGINVGSPSRLVAFLTDEVLEKFALGVLLHIALRTLGGIGDVRQSLSAFCFLCAFQPLVSASLIPGQFLTASLLQESSNSFAFIEQATAAIARLSIGDLANLALAFGLSTAVWLFFFVSLFRGLRALHRLSWPRTAAAFALALAGWFVFQLVVLYPFEANMYKAFSSRSG